MLSQFSNFPTNGENEGSVIYVDLNQQSQQNQLNSFSNTSNQQLNNICFTSKNISSPIPSNSQSSLSTLAPLIVEEDLDKKKIQSERTIGLKERCFFEIFVITHQALFVSTQQKIMLAKIVNKSKRSVSDWFSNMRRRSKEKECRLRYKNSSDSSLQKDFRSYKENWSWNGYSNKVSTQHNNSDSNLINGNSSSGCNQSTSLNNDFLESNNDKQKAPLSINYTFLKKLWSVLENETETQLKTRNAVCRDLLSKIIKLIVDSTERIYPGLDNDAVRDRNGIALESYLQCQKTKKPNNKYSVTPSNTNNIESDSNLNPIYNENKQYLQNENSSTELINSENNHNFIDSITRCTDDEETYQSLRKDKTLAISNSSRKRPIIQEVKEIMEKNRYEECLTSRDQASCIKKGKLSKQNTTNSVNASSGLINSDDGTCVAIDSSNRSSPSITNNNNNTEQKTSEQSLSFVPITSFGNAINCKTIFDTTPEKKNESGFYPCSDFFSCQNETSKFSSIKNVFSNNSIETNQNFVSSEQKQVLPTTSLFSTDSLSSNIRSHFYNELPFGFNVQKNGSNFESISGNNRQGSFLFNSNNNFNSNQLSMYGDQPLKQSKIFRTSNQTSNINPLIQPSFLFPSNRNIYDQNSQNRCGTIERNFTSLSSSHNLFDQEIGTNNNKSLLSSCCNTPIVIQKGSCSNLNANSEKQSSLLFPDSAKSTPVMCFSNNSPIKQEILYSSSSFQNYNQQRTNNSCILKNDLNRAMSPTSRLKVSVY